MRTRSQVLFDPRRSVSPRPSAGSGSTASEDNRKGNRKDTPKQKRETGKETQKTDAPMGAAGQRMGVQRPTEMRISSWLMLARAPNPRPAIRRCTEIRGCCGSPGRHPRIVTTGSVAWQTKCGPGRDFSGVASGPRRQHSRERDSAKPKLPNLDRLFHHALDLADGAVEA